MLNLSDILKHNASTFMYKYIKEKLPSSFNEMFAPFLEPYRTQSFKLELVRNKHLKPFQKYFLREFWIVLQWILNVHFQYLILKRIWKYIWLLDVRNLNVKTRNFYSCNIWLPKIRFFSSGFVHFSSAIHPCFLKLLCALYNCVSYLLISKNNLSLKLWRASQSKQPEMVRL